MKSDFPYNILSGKLVGGKGVDGWERMYLKRSDGYSGQTRRIFTIFFTFIMNFAPDQIYHLYNRTFNHTLAFPKRANYQFFIKGLRRLSPYCDILSYCISPDNFDIMFYVPAGSQGLKMTRCGQMQILSRRIGTLLSSYVQAYNKQQGRRGSLFQPKTKSKLLTADAPQCMRLIHSKPVNTGLTFRASDWEFSSLWEYEGMRDALCNISLAKRFRLWS